MKYEIFYRSWWEFNPEWPNRLEPCAGEKLHIKFVDTEDQARAFCKLYNAERLPEINPLSFKYEYREI